MQVQKSFKGQSSYGTLYLVPTPIGNLQDMTFRSVQILKEVDLICAEDTRNTGLLLKHFEVETKQYSFHEHNAYEKIPDLLERLKSGLSEDIPVVALPGASAGITALIASGLAPQPHIFYGFLPRKKGQQIDFFKEKVSYPETQIFYESPYRVADTLENMHEVYGNRQVTLVRELTKLYEEYQRGSISEILDYIASNPLKGECLLIVAGASENDREENLTSDVTPVEAVEALIASGMKPNQAIKTVAKERKINRQELYNLFHGV